MPLPLKKAYLSWLAGHSCCFIFSSKPVHCLASWTLVCLVDRYVPHDNSDAALRQATGTRLNLPTKACLKFHVSKSRILVTMHVIHPHSSSLQPWVQAAACMKSCSFYVAGKNMYKIAHRSIPYAHPTFASAQPFAHFSLYFRRSIQRRALLWQGMRSRVTKLQVAFSVVQFFVGN